MPDKFTIGKSLLKKASAKIPFRALWRLLPYSLIAEHPAWYRGTCEKTREDVYARVFEPLNEQRILFLEFGTFRGESIRHIAGINRHPSSAFYGFDTFTGLPHQWGLTAKGHFDTGSQTPSIDDGRVAFVKGLFRDTLVPFLSSPDFSDSWHEARLAVHIDSDLFSSAMTVLPALLMMLKPERFLLLFDEFCGDEAIAFATLVQIFDDYAFENICFTRQKYGYPFCSAFNVRRIVS